MQFLIESLRVAVQDADVLPTVSSESKSKEFTEQINRFYYKPVFWTGEYFVAGCGGVTIDHLKKYVEQQSSPTV